VLTAPSSESNRRVYSSYHHQRLTHKREEDSIDAHTQEKSSSKTQEAGEEAKPKEISPIGIRTSEDSRRRRLSKDQHTIQ